MTRDHTGGLRPFARVCAGEPVEVSPAAWARMQSSQYQLQNALDKGTTVYGITTGYGADSARRVPQTERAAFQTATIRSHACGFGDLASWSQARGVWVAKVASLTTGATGASPALVETMVGLLNAGYAPEVPLAGSLGASGDLIPSAHASLPLIGEGAVTDRAGYRLTGAEALSRCGLEPVTLGPRDGLSLVNGTAMTLSLAVHATLGLTELLEVADLLVAVSLELTGGHLEAFSRRITEARPHQGAIDTAAAVRRHLADSVPWSSPGRLHDPYAWRCVPQVHGAARSVSAWSGGLCEIELSSCSDNPVLDVGGEVVSGGNFHAAPLGIAADALVLAVGEVAALSRQRLAHQQRAVGARPIEGVGLTMVLTAATAALLELNSITPATGRWLPVDEVEDHVSNATLAARHALKALELGWMVAAAELIGLSVSMRHIGSRPVSAATRSVIDLLDKVCPNLRLDEPLGHVLTELAAELPALAGDDLGGDHLGGDHLGMSPDQADPFVVIPFI